MTNECMCGKCQKCCWHSCGWFGSIEEVEGAAKMKNMTVIDLCAEYLIREWYYAETIEIPAPRKNMLRTKNLSDDYSDEEKSRNGKGFVRASWGHNLMTGYACIFLDDNNRCSIHAASPQECRETYGCKTDSDSFQQRKYIEDYWKEHQDWVEDIVAQIRS